MTLAHSVITNDASTIYNKPMVREHGVQIDHSIPRAFIEEVFSFRADPSIYQRLTEEGQRLFLDRFAIEATGHSLLEH